MLGQFALLCPGALPGALPGVDVDGVDELDCA
jgi:hypothetical protein